MIEAYRLHSSRYPAHDGTGAALHGGRWNPPGAEAIYVSQSPSLAVLEILVHYADLPMDFVLTAISIPDDVTVMDVPPSELVSGWDAPVPVFFYS